MSSMSLAVNIRRSMYGVASARMAMPVLQLTLLQLGPLKKVLSQMGDLELVLLGDCDVGVSPMGLLGSANATAATARP